MEIEKIVANKKKLTVVEDEGKIVFISPGHGIRAHQKASAWIESQKYDLAYYLDSAKHADDVYARIAANKGKNPRPIDVPVSAINRFGRGRRW